MKRIWVGTAVVALALGGGSAGAGAAPAPFSTGPTPTFTVDTYSLTVRTKGSSVRHVGGRYQRFSTNPSDAAKVDIVGRDKLLLAGATRRTVGVRTLNPYISEPDGVTGPDDLGLRLGRFVVTQARAGRLNLVATSLGGRSVYKAEVDLAANACEKAPEGTATIWLTRTTLLPKRVDVERDNTTRTYNYAYAAFNDAVSNAALTSPGLGRRPQTINQRFKRRSPQAARGPLPFTPRLPTQLPTGFTLVQSGWAPQGARTGVRLLNKRDSWLFAAVYRRGWERIEITQRLATHGAWKVDPFQRSCQSIIGGRTTLGAIRVRYGVGPDVTSHVWFRDGNQLLTVSGPYGKNDLRTIAASLTKLS